MKSFICKVGDVANCQCSTVKLSLDAQNYIAEKYGDCLCCSCMREEQHGLALNKFYSKMKYILRKDHNQFNEKK